MGSDPLLTMVEAENSEFFASTAVTKVSDPIKSIPAYAQRDTESTDPQ